MYNIILPTYNERDNIIILLNMITDCMKEMKYKYKIIVVDDGSPDNTYKLILKSKIPNTFPIYRKGKNGLATAYKEAIKQCTYPFTFIMDADLSHDPIYMHDMIKIQKKNNADIVCSTRYNLKGGIYGWSFKRKFTSRFANDLATLFLDLKTSDCTGSFRLYKTKILYDLLNISLSKGYSIQMELIYMAEKRGLKIMECPIIFHEREKGISKLSVFEILYFLKIILHLLVKI